MENALREELLRAVREVVLDDLKLDLAPDQVQPDTPLFGTGLGLDSVDAVDLAVGVETRTGVKIPESWQGRAALRSVNHLVAFVLSQGGQVLPSEVQQAARAAVAGGMADQLRDAMGVGGDPDER